MIPIEDIFEFLRKYQDFEIVRKTKQKIRVKVTYPQNSYELVDLKFTKKLSESEKEKVYAIIEYWGNIPYVNGVDNVYYFQIANEILLDCCEENSNSGDPRKYKPLEKLSEWIQNGTPIRKTMNNSRAHEGVGDILLEVSAR